MAHDDLPILTTLGLLPTEARVYLGLLELGPETILRLSGHTAIKRSTVYSAVSSLVEKGLVNIQAKGRKRLFAAENPERLETLLESRRNDFRQVLPRLSAQFHQTRESESFIKHHHGISGIKTVYERFLNELQTGDFYYAISNQEKLFGLDPNFFDSFTDRRTKLDLRFRLILEDTAHARSYRQAERFKKGIVKLLPKERTVNTCVIVVPKRVIIVQLVEPIMAMEIDNPHVVHSNRMTFEMLWDSLPLPQLAVRQ